MVTLERVSWRSPPLFNYRASRDELTARFGPPSAVDLDSNGLGSFDAWMVRFECGLQIAIWQFNSDPWGVAITAENAPREVEIHANHPELHHLLFHLGLHVVAITRWAPDPTRVGERLWTLCRQDDNGHRHVVDNYTSRCEAESVAAAFAARGHKQLYWVEPDHAS